MGSIQYKEDIGYKGRFITYCHNINFEVSTYSTWLNVIKTVFSVARGGLLLILLCLPLLYFFTIHV